MTTEWERDAAEFEESLRREETRTMTSIKVGDRVKYATAWLRSIGAYTGPLGHARGTVTELTNLGGSTTLARVEWGDEDIPARINVKNLARADTPG